MIYQEITETAFIDAFRTSETRRNQFSYDALVELYHYYDGLGTDANDINFDMVGICCDWTEYDTLKEALESYNLKDLEALENMTTVFMLDNNKVLVCNY